MTTIRDLGSHPYHNKAERSWASRVTMLTLLVAAQGCSGRPADITAVKIDASTATDAAFAMYDTNSDGKLSQQELLECPSVLAAVALYDVDGDTQISKAEMSERIAAWATSSAPMMTVECLVTLDGRPLSDAEVKYVPEKYLADYLHSATGTTNVEGNAVVAIPPEHLAADHKRVQAVNPGAYKVEITHPTKKIPEKYNVQTTLGREVSRQTRAFPSERFDLTSR